jgi:NadR type nicotinamide-nucleotide adenylyltransferase
MEIMEQGFQQSVLRRIAVTGPESTGKSQLAEALAQYYSTVWVPEFARAYLESLGRSYEFEDLVNIAKGQLAAEKAMESSAHKLLFCDTECIVTKIWSEFKYKRCDEWIIQSIETHHYDLFLLCDVDLPWEYDPLREHPDERNVLFELYHNELEQRGFTYGIVTGSGKARLENALTIIRSTLGLK